MERDIIEVLVHAAQDLRADGWPDEALHGLEDLVRGHPGATDARATATLLERAGRAFRQNRVRRVK